MTDENHGPYLRHAGTILALADVYRGTEHRDGRKEDVATHTLMVVALTLDLAASIGLTDKETLAATNAALCHDYAETITGEIDTLFPLTKVQQEAKEAAEKAANELLWEENKIGALVLADFDGHWLAYYADKLAPILVGIHDDARSLCQRRVDPGWLVERKIKQFDAMKIPDEHRPFLMEVWDNAVDDLADRLERRATYNLDGEGEG